MWFPLDKSTKGYYSRIYNMGVSQSGGADRRSYRGNLFYCLKETVLCVEAAY